MRKENGCIKRFEGNKNKLSSPSVSVGDLPLPYSYEEDSRKHSSGMTNNLMGFTLIELLVVVLIIGILAAVALPQYQKAVEKSKAAQALTMLNTVYVAAEQYYLANGNHATSFEELSVDVPWTGTQVWYGNDVGRSRSNQDWSVELYRASNGSYPGVVVGRLKGAYAGAAFGRFLQPSVYGTGILCMERTNDNGVKFKKSAGAYCQKLFKGTLIESDSVRTYKLP